MSTEQEHTRTATTTRTSHRRPFRRALYGSIAVFSLLVAALIGANLAQGPRLKSVQVNVNTVVERTGQRLLLQANQQLAAISADQVTVTPAVPATATVKGDSITVQFADILTYDTAYTVTVTGAHAISVSTPATLTYTFTTPNPTVYFLSPPTEGGAGTSDAILSAPITGGAPVTVYAAPRIRQFLAFQKSLVVDTVSDDGSDALTIISLTGAAPIPVQLTGTGTVTSLKANPNSDLFGYTFTPNPSPLYTVQPDQLSAYDLTRGQDFAIPITGTDHEQLTAKDWLYIPGTTSLIAQTPDNSLQLIDTLGEREGTSGATRIGQADTIDGFIPTTKTLITTTGQTHTATDLSAAGNPASIFTLTPGGTTARAVIDPTGGHLEIVSTSDGPLTSVQKVNSQGVSTLFTVQPGTGTISHICLAPNGRYVVVGTSDLRIHFIDVADGTALGTFAGNRSTWCTTQ